MNVPIGAGMIVLARCIPESTRSRGRFDLTGAGSAALGVGALVMHRDGYPAVEPANAMTST